MSKCSFFNKTHSVRELWITVRPRSDASFHRWWRDRDIRHGRPLIPHPTGSSPYPSSSQVPRNPPTHDRGNSALVKHDIMCVWKSVECVSSLFLTQTFSDVNLWSLKKSRQFHTHIFGRSEVEEQVISSNRLHMEDDGVIAAFLDLWPVGADTVSTGRHRHLNLGVKGHERSSQRVQTTHDEWSYFSSCSL